MKRVLFLCICLITVPWSEGGSRLSLSDLFFTYVQDDIYPCFRLTNATHQIGCSGSATSTNGVLYYLNDTGDLARLKQDSPHAPYVALIEPAIFMAETVLELKILSSVKGIIVRHDPNLLFMDKIPARFSPERKCPNDLFGETSGCGTVWNPNGTNLIFTDFGDFPIFALPSSSFDSLVKCYSDLSRGNTGSSRDYPLCAVELTADMAVVKDTPTCFRRGALPVPFLTSQSFCDPLGDYSPWGSLFNLTDSTTDQVVLLTAKLDSISFFPGVLSPGASSEVAAIATLMGVIHQLGQAKRSGDVINTEKRILYAFLHGESWDYIGSSRMAYDMKNGDFPHKLELPRIGLTNISDILELGQLGFILNSKVYVHGNLEDSSSLIKDLADYASVVGISVESSSVNDLPPASLQRFIREGVKQGNSDFKGSVLTGFDSEFTNRYYGSRFDNILNLGSDSLSLVADRLANLSTAIAKAVLNDSHPSCVSESCSNAVNAMTADSDLVHDILTCFLLDASCDRFKSLFINHTAGALFANGSKLSRYVTKTYRNNTESVIVRQMMAWLSANDEMQRLRPINCSTCLQRILSGDDKTLNVTWMQYSGPESGGDEDLCYCVESYTYSHRAKSPAFDVSSIGYESREYSTWAESNWNSVQVRIFLAPSTELEVGFFFVGIAFASLTLAVSVLCTWKGSLLFNEGKSY